jgi:hypothetical protein
MWRKEKKSADIKKYVSDPSDRDILSTAYIGSRRTARKGYAV